MMTTGDRFTAAIVGFVALCFCALVLATVVAVWKAVLLG